MNTTTTDRPTRIIWGGDQHDTEGVTVIWDDDIEYDVAGTLDDAVELAREYGLDRHEVRPDGTHHYTA